MRIGLSSETETSGTRVVTNCGGELAELTDKVAGSILGQASGDAVGFIVAGCEREARGNRITSFFAEHVVGERPLGYGAQYSDNTQLARELAISICEQRGFVGDACAKRK